MDRLKSAIIKLATYLPTRVRNSILHFGFNIARPEFDRFAYLHSFAPSMEMGLSALAQRGITPVNIIDVGAFEGDWSRMVRRIWPDSRILMFEPNARKSEEVTRAAGEIGASLYQDLLGAEDGKEVNFNIMESGSSIMNERSSVPRFQELRRLRRLDSIVPNLGGSSLLKIDAQGYELEILKGATSILPKIDLIVLEVAAIEINEGAPIISEVVAFTKALGFEVCEILEIHRRPLDQAMNQVDIAFVRANSPLFKDKRHFA